MGFEPATDGIELCTFGWTSLFVVSLRIMVKMVK